MTNQLEKTYIDPTQTHRDTLRLLEIGLANNDIQTIDAAIQRMTQEFGESGAIATLCRIMEILDK